MAKRKRRATYNLHMPGEPGTDGTDLTMSGPIGVEPGRTLWLLAAAMGGLIPFNRLLLDFANGVIAATLGPMAPTRKRPRRIARKLAARRGRLHYPLRFR